MKKTIFAMILIALLIAPGMGRLPMKGDNVTISLIEDNAVVAYYGIINDTDNYLIVLDYDRVWLYGYDGPIKVNKETEIFGKSNIARMDWN